MNLIQTRGPAGSQIPTEARFAAVRARTEALAAPLSAEDQCVSRCRTPARPSGTWRTPPGSSRPSCCGRIARATGAFDAALRLPVQLLLRSPRPAASAAAARPADAALARRGQAYRAHVDAGDGRRCCATPPADGGWPLVELGLQHEQQHQELMLTDILHALSLQPAAAGLRARLAAAARGDGRRRPLARPARRRRRDRPRGPGFAFDNEVPRHRCWLAAVSRSPTGW